jgi:hypothetical protein
MDRALRDTELARNQESKLKEKKDCRLLVHQQLSRENNARRR